MCPSRGRTLRSESGTSLAWCSPCSNGTMRSASPCQNRIGTRISRSEKPHGLAEQHHVVDRRVQPRPGGVEHVVDEHLLHLGTPHHLLVAFGHAADEQIERLATPAAAEQRRWPT